MRFAADLCSPSAQRRLRAVAGVEHLQAVGDDDLRGLAACLSDSDKRVQRSAAEALAKLAAERPAALSLLVAALSSADCAARWGAAFGLAQMRSIDTSVIDVWLDFLGSDDSDLRWAAHQLLVRHLPDAGEPGMAALRTAAQSAEPRRRKLALYCLRDLAFAGDENEAVARAGLEAAEIGVRLAALAAYAASAGDHRSAADVVAGYLDDSDAQMRRAAAAALIKLDVFSPETRARLEAAADSPDGGLRRAARAALDR